MLKKLSVSLVVVLITSCVPIKYDYQYIHFDITPNLTITEYGKSMREGVKKQKKFPLKYRLNKDLYYIEIIQPKLLKGRSVFLRALSLDGTVLTVDYKNKFQKCGSLGTPLPENSEGLNVNEVKIFVWYSTKCDIGSEMVMTFEVIDKDGRILGREELPFTIKKNGYYYEYDAI